MMLPILIVNYNGRSFLEDCLSSLYHDEYPNIDPVVYVVDNQSTDDSVAYLEHTWPQVRVLRTPENLGFAAGNNIGWQQIQRDMPEAQYLFLLNQDTIVERGFLKPLLQAFEADPALGAAQPKLLLHPETTKINSLGNVIHFLGFGYSSYNGVEESLVHTMPREINYASGAAVMLRAAAVREVGLFDDFMFMYLEDLDLGWKLSIAGWHNQLVPQSRVYHKYEFSRGMRLYYYFERNRLWILMKNYHWATLLLLLPAWLMMELAQLLRAAMTGTLPQKIAAYAYFFSAKNLRQLRVDRSKLQRLRKRSDREIFGTFSGRIDFQPLESPLIRYIANPVFSLYHRLIHYCLFW